MGNMSIDRVLRGLYHQVNGVFLGWSMVYLLELVRYGYIELVYSMGA